MGQKIQERFVVRAPVDRVWAYLVDPRRVVTCLPGAELVEVVDERTFNGNVKVKAGPVTISYRGRVHLAEVDEASRRVEMVGEGRESTGTGAAKMTMESRLTALPGGETEVVVRAEVDVVGRLVQLGRGMIEQVSHQLFQQFAECVRQTLEAEAAPGQVAAGPPPRAEAVRAIPLLFRALWASIAALFRRLFGGKGT
jgi:carbon monoxide dehydrogenase subunit G